MPIGAMVARSELMTWQAGHHGSTFGGNPISCAVALETIKLLEEGLIDNAAARGHQLMAELRPLVERQPGLVRDVRGKGLMIGVEFASGDLAEAVQWACLQRGLLVLEAGDTCVRMSPPLIVTAEECATAARLFSEAVAEVALDPPVAIRAAHDGGAADEHVGG
jgi:4-aminobutyrate aminotransferase